MVFHPSSSALFLFQDAAAATASDVHLIAIFTGIIAICILLVIFAVVVGGLVAYAKVSKLSKDASRLGRQAQARAQPLIQKGQEIAGHVNEIVLDLKPKIAHISADLQPKIASISADAQHISAVVRGKVDEAGQTFTRVNETVQEVNGTVQDVNLKTKGQVERVNGLVSEALTTTQHVSKQIQHGIRVPVEKIASWVTAAKNSVENLAEKLPFVHTSSPTSTVGNPPTGNRPASGPRPVEPTPIRTTEYVRTSSFDE